MTAMAFINIRPIVKIDGEEDSDFRQALSSFVINLPLHGSAHGELTANNWIASGDAATQDFGFQAVGFGKTLDISMGEDEQQLLFSGEITGIEERYGDGTPQLVVLVQDKLHRLARSRNNRVFEQQSVDDVISTIAGELGLSPDVNVSTTTATFHQVNESDLAFVTRLAGAFGVAVRIEGQNLRARPETADAEPLELSVHDSATKVRLLADLNHQPTKITVKGFNPSNGESVSQDCEALDNAPEGMTAKNIIEEVSWAGTNIVPQPFPRSQGEAEAYAKTHFARLAKRFISGDLICTGEPTLKSGREVDLSGVSPRFAGKYQVVHCVHCFDNARGFETRLKINRADGQR